MMHLNFALAIYPQRRGEWNSPYILSPALREESWGLLKVLLGTTYACLEDDLHTLAFPADLRITTYDDTLVRLYECRALKRSTHYPEGKRVQEAVYALGKVSGICAEMVAVNRGDIAFSHRTGQHSNLLTTVSSIQVNL